jgi:phospholipase/carboxylesterase
VKRFFIVSLMIAAALTAEVDTLSAPFQTELSYIVELPEDYDSTRTYPLIVALHGFGDRMSSYVGTAQSFYPDGAIGLYPETPYPVDLEGNLGWAWYMWGDSGFHRKTVDQSTRWVLSCIQQVKENYPVDPRKVFLYGFSQGGMMTYEVGIRYPELFRGLLPAGGWLEVEIDSINPLDSAALSLPVRALHGVYDNVVNFEDGDAAITTLVEYGVPAEIMRYPCKHQITREMVEDARDFVYCRLDAEEPPPLTALIWPDEELEPAAHAELLKSILCLDDPVADIEAGLLELYREQESTELREQIIYLLGARRCVGSEPLLNQILADESEPQMLRQAACSALIKLATETAWQATEGVKKLVVIKEVVPGTQADSLGLEEGDVILRYNRKKIKAYADLRKAIGSVKPEKKEVEMLILRDVRRIRIRLKPGRIGIYLDEVIR